MDDFLHNLRSGKLKQQDRSRRGFDNYKGPQRRAGADRRNDYHKKGKPDHLEIIKEALNKIVKSREKMADAYEARSVIEERKAAALEAISKDLSVFLSAGELSEKTPALPDVDQMPEKKPKTPVKKQKAIDKTAVQLADDDKQMVFEMISTLREKKESWEQIARHLESENIPTLSGKGKWRGQVAKKLYDKIA